MTFETIRFIVKATSVSLIVVPAFLAGLGCAAVSVAIPFILAGFPSMIFLEQGLSTKRPEATWTTVRELHESKQETRPNRATA